MSDLEQVLETRDDPPTGERPRHTTRLLALITELLEQAGTSFGELDRIAVGLGPGTFTGLRIGIATARALAQARSVELVGVSTLHSLALNGQVAVGSQGDLATVSPILDARRGEVFAAAWSAGALEDEPLVTPSAIAPEALAQRLVARGIEPAKTLAIGDGALAFRQVVEQSGVRVPGDRSELHLVTAANHLRLARSLAPRHPDDIHACYLRSPDAQPARQFLAPAP